MLKSIAFIPDGNRRFAKESGMSLAKAYSLGVKKAWQTLEWLEEYPSIRVGSFYALSLKNLERSKRELNLLFKIFDKEFLSIKKKNYLRDKGIRVKFIGRLDLLGKHIRKHILDIESKTADLNNKLINIAIGYDGRREIVDAAVNIAREVSEGKLRANEVDEKVFSNYLYGNFQEPDLIIRTSGEQRLSGFLTYLSAYSELYFCQKYWPEFEKRDLDEAIAEYSRRERRFGK
ncbi:MAG: polyprenyl diphosphate synthase [Candidatus Diapherotrites archaeon]|nr:polyprenyl diphosphate synthase [Candidatus Diapherotrites archaeon]